VMANILIVVITGVEEVGRSSSSIAGTATCWGPDTETVTLLIVTIYKGQHYLRAGGHLCCQYTLYPVASSSTSMKEPQQEAEGHRNLNLNKEVMVNDLKSRVMPQRYRVAYTIHQRLPGHYFH
jgi:hypothetical protein